MRKRYTLSLDLTAPALVLVATLEGPGVQVVTVGSRDGAGDETARLAQWLASDRATRQLLQAALYACGKVGEIEEPDE
jgi:hypothetical protein